MVAGSILPIAFHNGKLYFLFGKENPMEDSQKGWSDFGGGVENGETPFKTALREGGEELTGFLGDEKSIHKLLKKSGFHKIVHNKYHVHAFFMDYDENLPKHYNNNHKFLWERMDKQYLNSTKLFEKIEIKWFSVEELTSMRSVFREFYREIVDKIKENIPQLMKMHNKRAKSKTKHTRKLHGG
jgi:8-oxo-dGTP pyrophosphatase MutT (NUDIX family)